MSTSEEKIRAVNRMGEAVVAFGPYLRRKGQNVLIPKALLLAAFACLRHYPAPYEVELRFGKDHQ